MREDVVDAIASMARAVNETNKALQAASIGNGAMMTFVDNLSRALALENAASTIALNAASATEDEREALVREKKLGDRIGLAVVAATIVLHFAVIRSVRKGEFSQGAYKACRYVGYLTYLALFVRYKDLMELGAKVAWDNFSKADRVIPFITVIATVIGLVRESYIVTYTASGFKKGASGIEITTLALVGFACYTGYRSYGAYKTRQVGEVDVAIERVNHEYPVIKQGVATLFNTAVAA